MRLTNGPGSQSKTKPGADDVRQADVLSRLTDADLARLTEQVTRRLLGTDYSAKMIDAIEAVVFKRVNNGPGSLLAGVISSSAGAIQWASGGNPTTAMVFLQGGSVATPVYIPPHLEADIVISQEIWVTPVNGRRDDLVMVAVRAFTGVPAQRIAWEATPQTVWAAAAIGAAGTLTATIRGSFNVPANATGIIAQVAYSSAVAGSFATIQPGATGAGTSHWFIIGNVQVGGTTVNTQAVIPFDATNGQITAWSQNAGTISLYIVGWTE